MKITVHLFSSLDGVVQSPGGAEEDPSGGFDRGGWIGAHSMDGQLAVVDSWFAKADALLLGRTTFEAMRSYWPHVQGEDATTTTLNRGRKYVVSTTLADEDTGWGDTTVIRGDVLARIRELKGAPGRELQVHGSWQLVRSLHDQGLVDVYRIIQLPVVLGAGKRIFDTGSVPASYRVTAGDVVSAGSGAVWFELEQTSFGDVAQSELTVVEGAEAVR